MLLVISNQLIYDFFADCVFLSNFWSNKTFIDSHSPLKIESFYLMIVVLALHPFYSDKKVFTLFTFLDYQTHQGVDLY